MDAYEFVAQKMREWEKAERRGIYIKRHVYTRQGEPHDTRVKAHVGDRIRWKSHEGIVYEVVHRKKVVPAWRTLGYTRGVFSDAPNHIKS